MLGDSRMQGYLETILLESSDASNPSEQTRLVMYRHKICARRGKIPIQLAFALAVLDVPSFWTTMLITVYFCIQNNASGGRVKPIMSFRSS